MSGNAPAIKARFLSRSAGGMRVIEGVPTSSRINFNTDVRQIAANFDFQFEFLPSESFPVKSHDIVEFYFDLDGVPFQIGTGYVEDFVKDTSDAADTFHANGRNLMGQLMDIPFTVQIINKGQTLKAFVEKALDNTYAKSYAAFRGLHRSIVDVNSYPGPLTICTDGQRKRGPIVQEYADLVFNLVYMNRLGQVVLYGRPEGGPSQKSVGTLIKSAGRSNVSHITQKEDFSKVISEVTVFWVTGEKNLSDSQVPASDKFKNTDPRVSHLYNPLVRVFSAHDLVDLAGTQTHKLRMNQLSKSEIRKSNQNLNTVIVETGEPFAVDPSTGRKIPFEALQTWRIVDERKGIDQDMTLASLSYAQDPQGLSVQLGFVEPDTLV